MSIFSRFFKIGQAHANKALDAMEKPEVMLEQAIRDKENQIREAKMAVQQVIATERQTKAQLEREKSDQITWERKAEAALTAGNEDLAGKALVRATEHEKRSQGLVPTWEGYRTNVEQLKQEIIQMEDQLSEFKRNKDFIIAQSKTAEVKKQIYEAKARISKDNTADDLMARMKAKAERANFEADAAQEMSESFGGGDSLEKEFSKLEGPSGNSEVQAKLEALKAKMGK